MSIIADTWRSARVCAVFLALAAGTTVVTWVVPAFTNLIVLSPPHVLGAGYLWQLITYPLYQVSLLHLAVVAALLATLGGLVEPHLGRRRSILLLISAAVLSGLSYVAIERLAPFGGAAFIASAFASAFVVLWFRQRATAPRWQIVLVVLFAVHVGLVSLSPLNLLAPHAVSWAVGAVFAFPVARRPAAGADNEQLGSIGA